MPLIFKGFISLSALSLAVLTMTLPALSQASEIGTLPHTDFEIDIDELAMRDKELSDNIAEMCHIMGDSDCNIILTSCSETPIPNSCFLRTLLFHAMDEATCSEGSLQECSAERSRYESRVSDFSSDYANQPGIGRAALNSCFSFYKVDIDSPTLINVKEELDNVMPGLGEYIDYKGLYHCIRDQYMEMTRGIISQ
ncbi:hypothetical protein M0220_08375 [Halomonas qinghailakensis]|uniref:Secreted protein n=1 Tax=Halomonas qinghailakensis TaxID=2937790 RepID=A0AA46YS60_9GAMM|nr:hypothetical protein [Halomonas sp. ZZQ-149]UYO76145.1 hypothetical protein M0220_08375 [Halomonas sp. ZZQ-149]